MDLLDISASSIGVVVFGAIMCFVMWNYYNKEKKQNDFLQDRIRDYKTEQNLLKSKRQEKIEQELEDLGNPISYEDLIECGSELKVKESGKARLEGKEYLMQDGDICHFRFNV